jgi:hypothetical protein
MRLAYIVILILLISCTRKNDSPDFVDKIIDLAIEVSNGQYIELPNLHDTLTTYIPEYRYDRIILLENLKRRGFKIVGHIEGNYPPLGPKIITVTLRKGDCDCAVNKIYYFSTLSKSAYEMRENIFCRRKL